MPCRRRELMTVRQSSVNGHLLTAYLRMTCIPSNPWKILTLSLIVWCFICVTFYCLGVPLHILTLTPEEIKRIYERLRELCRSSILSTLACTTIIAATHLELTT